MANRPVSQTPCGVCGVVQKTNSHYHGSVEVYCMKHYQQLNRGGKITFGVRPGRKVNPNHCKQEGCIDKVASYGYCMKHYLKLRRKNSPLLPVKRKHTKSIVTKGGFIRGKNQRIDTTGGSSNS